MPEDAEYGARTVETPDGEARITIVYRLPSAVPDMTDAEFLDTFNQDPASLGAVVHDQD